MRLTVPTSPWFFTGQDDLWPSWDIDLGVDHINELIWAQQERLSELIQVIRDNAEVYPIRSRTRHDGYAWCYKMLQDGYTIVIHTRTREHDLMARIRHEADRDAQLRVNLDSSDSLLAPSERAEGFFDKVSKKYIKTDQRVESATRPVRGGGLFRSARVVIDEDVLVEKYLGRSCAYEYVGPEHVHVFLPALGAYQLDGDFMVGAAVPALRWPTLMVPELNFIIDRMTPFSARDLPGLEAAESLLLIQQLARLGYLVPLVE